VIAEVPDGPTKNAGVLPGRRAALAILEDRATIWPGYPKQGGMAMSQLRAAWAHRSGSQSARRRFNR
jgi:hypothetical protein